MAFIDHAPDRHRGQYRALALFLLLTLAVGAVGAFATEPEIAGWYATLVKPAFNPPNWVFAPVWTILYVLMAVAAWRVWRIEGLASTPLMLFFAQLSLNAAWSFLFFHAHAIGAALADIAALLAFVLWTGLSFARRDRVAGALFLPYFLWVAFAACLNAAIWELN